MTHRQRRPKPATPPGPIRNIPELAGINMSSDLGGSADAPTVAKLRPKAKNSAVVHIIGNETSAALTQFGQ
jgi:hypothetical protein